MSSISLFFFASLWLYRQCFLINGCALSRISQVIVWLMCLSFSDLMWLESAVWFASSFLNDDLCVLNLDLKVLQVSPV